jgi:hypothetical protein
MLVCSGANLVFLAVPKTGSTAIEVALMKHADIVFGKHRKHMTAHRYHKVIAPFLGDTMGVHPETMAVIRDPVERLRSWYRFRKRGDVDRADHSTGKLSFDDFIRDVISEAPPPHAQIGNQHSFLCDEDGTVRVDHLFAYERQQMLRGFLSARMGEGLVFKQKNVSPEVPTALSPKMEDALRAARASEFALHARALALGHLTV